MRLRSGRRNPKDFLANLHQPWIRRVLRYSVTLFFLAFGDAILTYFSPVYTESLVQNELWMGIIIATSSMVGLGCDIFFGEWFSGKNHRFFFKYALVAYVLFALSFLLLPKHPGFILVSMALWGVGFELILFSDFHFISEALEHPHHAIGWSVVKTFTGVAYMMGPLVASLLLNLEPLWAPMGALVMVGVSLVFYICLGREKPKRAIINVSINRKRSVWHELKIWRLLLPKLWVVMLFIFMVTVVDATFWTVGTVLSENLKELHPFGGFLVTVYMLPSLFAYFVGSWLGGFWGKKRMAFFAGLLAGLGFMVAGMTLEIIPLLLGVFGASFCLSLATPEIFAAVEDYIERLGHSSNALIGLENSVTSLSFIVGPILAGLVANIWGDQATFRVIGGLLAAISLLALLTVPRKIQLPQKELAEIR